MADNPTLSLARSEAHMQGQRIAWCGHHSQQESFEDQFVRFVSRLQVLAGEVAQSARPLHEIAPAIGASLPWIHTPAAFLLVRSVLADFCARALENAPPYRVRSVLKLATLPPPAGTDLCACCVLDHALVASLTGPKAPAEPPVPESLRSLRSVRAMAVIRTRCCEPTITAESVASCVGVSRAYLGKLLHLHQGCGFRAALRRARLEHARTLLARSLCSIKEIAGSSGFTSTSQFDRAFRRQYAVTPGEYRRGCLAAPHIMDGPPYSG